MAKLTTDQLREKHSERYQELERQRDDAYAILDGYKKQHGVLEIFFDSLAKNLNPITPLQIVHKKQTKQSSPIVAVCQISDVHMGEVQVGSEIEEFNEYNPEIAEARCMDYMTRFVDWVYMHRTSYSINECAVFVTGDLVSNDIHHELSVTNAFPAPVQCVKAAELLAKQIIAIAPHFDKITVHFVVEDNHARLTKKPQAKEAGLNTLNYVVGFMASLFLKNHSNVDFKLYPVYETVVNVNSRMCLLSHGHGVIGFAGIPLYGIERKVAKESMARMQIIMNDITRAKQIGFHRMYFGHWHFPFDMPLYSCCGSVSGTSAYDHKNGRYAQPSQSAWLVSSKWGDFNRINFIFK